MQLVCHTLGLHLFLSVFQLFNLLRKQRNQLLFAGYNILQNEDVFVVRAGNLHHLQEGRLCCHQHNTGEMDDVCYHQGREEAAAAGTYRLQHLEEFFLAVKNLGG